MELGFGIRWTIFWIPKPRIPDSHKQKLLEFRNPDSLGGDIFFINQIELLEYLSELSSRVFFCTGINNKKETIYIAIYGYQKNH